MEPPPGPVSAVKVVDPGGGDNHQRPGRQRQIRQRQNLRIIAGWKDAAIVSLTPGAVEIAVQVEAGGGIDLKCGFVVGKAERSPSAGKPAGDRSSWEKLLTRRRYLKLFRALGGRRGALDR